MGASGRPVDGVSSDRAGRVGKDSTSGCLFVSCVRVNTFALSVRNARRLTLSLWGRADVCGERGLGRDVNFREQSELIERCVLQAPGWLRRVH